MTSLCSVVAPWMFIGVTGTLKSHQFFCLYLAGEIDDKQYNAGHSVHVE